MKLENVKISENIYNGVYDVGSIFENSVNLTMDDKIFEDGVSKITKDQILTATFKRTFIDKNLNPVSIELAAPMIDDEILMDLIKKIAVSENVIVKERDFSLDDYLEKITITINNQDEYEIAKESELGKQLISVVALDVLMSKSNYELIASIEL